MSLHIKTWYKYDITSYVLGRISWVSDGSGWLRYFRRVVCNKSFSTVRGTTSEYYYKSYEILLRPILLNIRWELLAHTHPHVYSCKDRMYLQMCSQRVCMYICFIYVCVYIGFFGRRMRERYHIHEWIRTHLHTSGWACVSKLSRSGWTKNIIINGYHHHHHY